MSSPEIGCHKKIRQWKNKKKRKQLAHKSKKRNESLYYFSEAEKRKIIEEMIERDCTKQDIWKKYTGRKQEHGSIIVIVKFHKVVDENLC